MEAKAKLFGHSIHQMLIVFPLGLLGMGVVFDVVFMTLQNQLFAAVAYWMIVAGLVGGLLAAPFGLKSRQERRRGSWYRQRGRGRIVPW